MVSSNTKYYSPFAGSLTVMGSLVRSIPGTICRLIQYWWFGAVQHFGASEGSPWFDDSETVQGNRGADNDGDDNSVVCRTTSGCGLLEPKVLTDSSSSISSISRKFCYTHISQVYIKAYSSRSKYAIPTLTWPTKQRCLGFSEVLSSLGDWTFLGLSVLPAQVRGIDMGPGRAWLCSVGPGGTWPEVNRTRVTLTKGEDGRALKGTEG